MNNRIWIVLYFAWLAAVIFLSLDPSPPRVDIELLSWDKLQHAGAYGVMTILGGLGPGRWIASVLRRWLVFAAVAVSVGLLLEAGQGLMQAGRCADWHDAVANSVGAATALLLVAALRRSRGGGPSAQGPELPAAGSGRE